MNVNDLKTHVDAIIADCINAANTSAEAECDFFGKLAYRAFIENDQIAGKWLSACQFMDCGWHGYQYWTPSYEEVIGAVPGYLHIASSLDHEPNFRPISTNDNRNPAFAKWIRWAIG